jgi:hypothetical protein
MKIGDGDGGGGFQSAFSGHLSTFKLSSSATLLHSAIEMRFIRHSNEPMSGVTPRVQDGLDDGWSKPVGLWFSVAMEDGNDPWLDYCKMRRWPVAPYRTEIFINDDSILHVGDAAGIDNLTSKYGFVPLSVHTRKPSRRSGIHWDILAQKYDGIVIAPACGERRQEELWYYTWDVASGCIWNADGIRSWQSLNPAGHN